MGRACVHWKCLDRVTCLPDGSLLESDCDCHRLTGAREILTVIPNTAESLLVVDAPSCPGECHMHPTFTIPSMWIFRRRSAGISIDRAFMAMLSGMTVILSDQI